MALDTYKSNDITSLGARPHLLVFVQFTAILYCMNF